jgi:hypothetical protein
VLRVNERKELYRMLSRLSEGQRVLVLRRCCQKVSQGLKEVKVLSSSGSLGEVWADLMLLVVEHGLPLDSIGMELQNELRRG